MATTASMSTSASAARMASSAARPASRLSPRPIQLKAAQAAASVTRRREKTSSGLAGPDILEAPLNGDPARTRPGTGRGSRHYSLWFEGHLAFEDVGQNPCARDVSTRTAPRIERVAQGIAEHVDRDKQADQHEPRNDRHPPCAGEHEVVAGTDQGAE